MSQQPDPNEEAAKLVRELTSRHDEQLPADVEAAWTRWSASIHSCDQRTRELMRAAFEAGHESGSRRKSEKSGGRETGPETLRKP